MARTKAEILQAIREIETSEEYSERSDAGDDTLWYVIESLYEELEELEKEEG
jgi:hypothetical protein